MTTYLREHPAPNAEQLAAIAKLEAEARADRGRGTGREPAPNRGAARHRSRAAFSLGRHAWNRKNASRHRTSARLRYSGSDLGHTRDAGRRIFLADRGGAELSIVSRKFGWGVPGLVRNSEL